MNELQIHTAQVPAYLRGEVEPAANAGLILTGESVPRISIRGKRFRLKVPGKEEMVGQAGAPLTVVVLGYSPAQGCSKSFYLDEYQPGSGEAPDCSSADGVRPDTWAEDPQAKTCADCPHNEWGSGKNGKGKRCSDHKQLIVAAPGQLEGGDLYVLTVPPTSLRPLTQYARQLSEHSIPIRAVKTVCDFADTEHPQLEFSFGDFLTEGQFEAAKRRERDVESTIAKISRAAGAPKNPGGYAPQPETSSLPPRPTYLDPEDTQAAPQDSAANSAAESAQNSSETPSEPKKRKRRTKAEMEAARAAESAAQTPSELPPAPPAEGGAAAAVESILSAWE